MESEAALVNAVALNRTLEEVEFAKALVNKGVALSQLGRNIEAITVFDEMIVRFGEATDLLIKGQAATARSLRDPLQNS